MTGSNSTTAPVMTFIKDLKLEMNNFSLTFIVLEIGRPTITEENREVRTVQASNGVTSIVRNVICNGVCCVRI